MALAKIGFIFDNISKDYNIKASGYFEGYFLTRKHNKTCTRQIFYQFKMYFPKYKLKYKFGKNRQSSYYL